MLLPIFVVAHAQQTPSEILWVRVDNTRFTGGYGQVVVPIADGFMIFRQYMANQKLELEIYRVQEGGDINLVRQKTWPKGRTEPPDFESGTAAAWDGKDHVYFLLGAAEEHQRFFFYVYNIRTDSWTKLADTPARQGAGNALAYVKQNEGELLYSFCGQYKLQAAFLRYHVGEDRWEALASPEGWVYTDDGAALAFVGDGYLYALQGSGFGDKPAPSFARFQLPNGPWENLSLIPDPTGVNDGGSLAWDGGRFIYATSGGYDEKGREASGKGFFRYDLHQQSWRTLAPVPCPLGKYTGNRLAVVNGFLFMWEGTIPGASPCDGTGIWRLLLPLE